MTLIEKITEDFVRTILRDHPIMLYEIHTELSEYISANEQLEKKLYEKDSAELREFLKSPKCKEIDVQINQELISKAGVSSNNGELPYGYLDTTEYTDEGLFEEDQTLYYLVHLVLKSNSVRKKKMYKIEEELDDPIMPNIWVYHKESDMDKVLEYIKNGYDLLRREDEIEKEEEDEMTGR